MSTRRTAQTTSLAASPCYNFGRSFCVQRTGDLGFRRAKDDSALLDGRNAWLADLPLAEPALATAQNPADDEAARTEILESAQWRRAMFEVNEWLMNQPAYSPEQVEEMRGDFRQRVAEMNAEELRLLLGDLDTKMQILDNPRVREARAWMAEYVSVMSDRKREEVQRDLPNLARMTPDQLHQEVLRIKAKRARMDQRQSAFARTQSQQVATQLQAHQASQPRPDRRSRPAPLSPYRSQSNVNDRLNATPPNARPSFFVNPGGSLGRVLPGSW